MKRVPVYYIYGNSKALAAIPTPDPKYYGWDRVRDQEIYMLWRKNDYSDSYIGLAQLAESMVGPKIEVIRQFHNIADWQVAAVESHSGYLHFNIHKKDGFKRLQFETLNRVQFCIRYEHPLTGATHKMPISDVFILGETNNGRKLLRMVKRSVGDGAILTGLWLEELRRRIGPRNQVYIRNMNGIVINLADMSILDTYRPYQGEQECLIMDRKVVMTSVSVRAPKALNKFNNLCAIIH